MKKSFIIAGVLLLIAGGFFLYRWLAPREKADPLTVVPENAVLIIETPDIYQVWDSLKSKKLWKNLQAVPSIESLSHKISSLDSLFGENTQREFFQGKKVVVSWHVTPGKNSEYIFYIPVNSSKDENVLVGTLENIKKQNKYVIEEHTFQDYTIGSITSKVTKTSFSFINYKNLFIGSFSTVLLEDLIRSMDKKRDYFFWKKEEKVKKLADGLTTFYVNYSQLPSLFSLFSEHETFKPIASFADESLLEFNVNEKELLLNGFTYSSSQKLSFINCFKSQLPQQFYLKNYVPNSTSAVFYYGFDNPRSLRKSLEEFWKKEDPSYISEVTAFNKEYGVDVGNLYLDFGNEIGLCFSTKDTSMSNKMVLIHSKDSELLVLQLNKIVDAVASKKQSSRQHETWQGVKIQKMDIPEFPSKVLGRIFEGFPECYYAAIDNYVVLANNKKIIKDLVKDIEAENVWGKSLDINSSLEETITEFNVGLFVNMQSSWESLTGYGSPETKGELMKNKRLLQGFDFLALQFSHLNQTVLTNIVLTHNLSEPLIVEEEPEVQKELQMETIPVRCFYLADSKGPGKDLLIQDSLLIIQMIGADMKPKWKFPVKSSITGEVFTADIDKDRKWEYVFAAGNKIYALDGKGNLMKKFPIKVSDTIDHLTVMDYSNNKEYRIVVSDRKGNVYFYDLKGTNLDGWRPKKLSGKLMAKVRHLRVGDKDLILAVEERGVVNVMNRRGEMYNGFPLTLNSGTIKSLVIKSGKDLEKTLCTVQNEQGELISFNLKGKIVKKEQSQVLLCPDSKGLSYAIVKGHAGSTTIENGNSKRTFQIPFNLANVSIKYSNFSTKGDFITIKELTGKKVMIYNENGKAMLKEPVSSDFHSELFYNERKKVFGMYNLYHNRLEVIEF